ncbi:hypothetical protein B0H11DRAFT_2210083 [Mycena galericulata]|nr:hypothetical protein B0H11DRAFT_2210083 [Mycena galericulata]
MALNWPKKCSRDKWSSQVRLSTSRKKSFFYGEHVIQAIQVHSSDKKSVKRLMKEIIPSLLRVEFSKQNTARTPAQNATGRRNNSAPTWYKTATDPEHELTTWLCQDDFSEKSLGQPVLCGAN